MYDGKITQVAFVACLDACLVGGLRLFSPFKVREPVSCFYMESLPLSFVRDCWAIL